MDRVTGGLFLFKRGHYSTFFMELGLPLCSVFDIDACLVLKSKGWVGEWQWQLKIS